MDQPSDPSIVEQIAENDYQVEKLQELTKKQFGELSDQLFGLFNSFLGFGKGNGILEQYQNALNNGTLDNVSDILDPSERRSEHYSVDFIPPSIFSNDRNYYMALSLKGRGHLELNMGDKNDGSSINLRTNVLQINDYAPYTILSLRNFKPGEVPPSLNSAIKLIPSKSFIEGGPTSSSENYLRVEYDFFNQAYIANPPHNSISYCNPLHIHINNGKFTVEYNYSFNPVTGMFEIKSDKLWVDSTQMGNLPVVEGSIETVSSDRKIGLNIVDIGGRIDFIPQRSPGFYDLYSTPGISIPKVIQPFDLLKSSGANNSLGDGTLQLDEGL